MQIIRLEPTHANDYRSLMLSAYAQHPQAFTSSVDERASLPLSWWESRLAPGEAPDELVFGCLQDQQLAGVAGLAFERRDKVRHKASLFGMYVPAQYRRLGLGKHLVRHALSYARTRPGVRLVQLSVTDGNIAARSLYEHQGFKPFGLEPMAVAVDAGYVDKLHMWCPLKASPSGA
jgi:ribosomal protein S18 acetylase RimI-like enzyme